VRRKPRKLCHCDKPSIPGPTGLCLYHWDVLAFGKRWADHCQALRERETTGEEAAYDYYTTAPSRMESHNVTPPL
jgi:hypothetical protein